MSDIFSGISFCVLRIWQGTLMLFMLKVFWLIFPTWNILISCEIDELVYLIFVMYITVFPL